MKWVKLGLIYEPKNKNEFIITHCANPLAFNLEKNIYRIFYNGRNKDNKSSISYFDFNIETLKIKEDFEGSFFNFQDDTFYSDGISIGNIWEIEGKKFLNFMGWKAPKNKHWYGQIGYFEFENNSLKNPKILLGINELDKISLSYPHIMYDNNIYKMWYGSTVDWTSENGEMIHVIKYATSIDCLKWDIHDICIPYKLNIQQAFSRPTVIKINNEYHMWYSFRSGDGTPYRIGHCKSSNGIEWAVEEPGIYCSENGWDSQMICYPFVFKHNDYFYLLYNGNDFGKTGIGIAKLEIN